MKSRKIIKLLVYIALPVFVFATSCKNSGKLKNSRKTVTEWIGKEIKYPEGLRCYSMLNDTVCPDLHTDNYKIVVYADSLGCTSCRLQLPAWKNIMEEADTVFAKKPDFLFFFCPKQRDEKEVLSILQINAFRHPVFIDKSNEIEQLNSFPSQSEYQCFLLDKDNKVVLVGNPAINRGLWTLYKKIILEKEN